MRQLSLDMIRSLTSACQVCRIGSHDLLAGLAGEIRANVPQGDTPTTQIMQALCHLNELSAAGREPNPLLEALKTGRLLAGPRPVAAVFEEMIGHLSADATVPDPTRRRAFLDIATRRMKEAYQAIGCHVTPPLESRASPFLAVHPGGHTSVVAVSYQEEEASPPLDVDATIHEVNKWLSTARQGGDDAEGYVVLAPAAWPAAEAKIRGAGLCPIDFQQRRGIGLDTIEALVRDRLGSIPVSGVTSSFLHDGQAVSTGGAISAFFQDIRARVAIFIQPRGAAMEDFTAELFHACAAQFLRQSTPAPLLVGDRWRSTRLLEWACEELARCGQHAAPMALSPLLREGALCPLFVCGADAPSPPSTELLLVPRVLEGVSDRSKALVVFSHADIAAAKRVKSSLGGRGCGPVLVRALS